MSTLSQRLRIWQLIFLFSFTGVILRLGYWQLWKHDELASYAAQQYSSLQTLQTQRGQIFDRNGHVLVSNEERYTLFAEPRQLKQPPAEIVKQLSPILLEGVMALASPLQASDSAWVTAQTEQLDARLLGALSGEKRWTPLFPRLSREQRAKIEALQIFGLGFDRYLYRSYPDASVSAHLLGFVGKDDAGDDQGYFGLEGYYNLELRGREGRVESQQTALGLPLALGSSQEISARPGRDLHLTLDKALQYQVEQKLLSGMQRYGARAGEIIIMDPHTGEILAMASFPNYDPARFIEFDPRLYRNPSVSDLYEPGSTFKVLTVAAGIEERVITPETQCSTCAGPRMISGFQIKTWNEVYNPDVTMRDALAKSDNTAMVFIQEQLGKERFLSWLRRFGLNRTTGIDVQGEAEYLFREDNQWRQVDVATASFGQGIAMTSVNLLRAVASIANGGKLVRPYIVQAVIEDDEVHEAKPEVQEQVISPETAKIVTEMMVYTADQGDAKWTDREDLEVAGKTGTAQIAEGGKYLEDKTLTSFIGFFPASQPKYIMLVKLREPTSSPWGSETAAPLWYDVAEMLH